MTTASEPQCCNLTDNWYYIHEDEPNLIASENILGDEIVYTFDPSKNFYNVFIIANETSMVAMIHYAIAILEDAYSSIPSFWGFLSPTFFVVSIKKENGSYYESINIFLNGMITKNFVSNFPLLIHGNLTKHLSTNLAQKYLKEFYNAPFNKSDEQWNIIISDEFPFWIKDASITFDSFNQHMDVYLLCNDSNKADELKHEVKSHIHDILVDDGNTTIRGNHLMVINIGGQSYIEVVKQMPSIKKYLASTSYSYKSPNRWWIWLIVGAFIFLLFIVAIGAILFWRYRVYKLMRSIKEANGFIEKGKELFIDGNFIEVDFNKIIGKGSSAVVYEGILSTESPVAALYPRLKTRNYSNCKAAIKIGNNFSKDEFEQIFREVEAAIKTGWHRHICCLLGWSVNQSMPILVFELIEGKDLLSWIHSFELEQIPEKAATQILWQIANGMEHVASLGIRAKITDFGLASSCNETFTYEAPIQRRLPFRWMAPETLKNRLFSEFSDVWSFAVLAWEVFNHGEILYGNIDGNDILEFLSNENRLQLPEEISEGWKRLLTKCWNENKDERPTFKKIRTQIGAFLETQTLNYGYLAFENNKDEDDEKEN